MNKFRVLLGFAIAIGPSLASAGCLEGLTTSGVVTSKVRGLYMNRTAAGAAHFLIIDKATCQATPSGDAVLGSTTKSAHYLRIRDEDKAMLSVILASQAQSQVVSFRLNPGPAVDNINEVAYLISPAGAEAQ